MILECMTLYWTILKYQNYMQVLYLSILKQYLIVGLLPAQPAPISTAQPLEHLCVAREASTFLKAQAQDARRVPKARTQTALEVLASPASQAS